MNKTNQETLKLLTEATEILDTIAFEEAVERNKKISKFKQKVVKHLLKLAKDDK